MSLVHGCEVHDLDGFCGAVDCGDVDLLGGIARVPNRLQKHLRRGRGNGAGRIVSGTYVENEIILFSTG